MYEDIDARREARRRRILENSENRLKKITGVQNRTSNFDIEGYKTPEPSIQLEASPLINGELHQETSEHLQDILLRNSISNQPNIVTNHKLNLDAYRVPIILLLAFIQNIMLTILNISQIFVPLLCFEAIDIFYSEHEPSSFLIKSLTLIKFKMPKRQLVLIVRCLNLLKTFFKDVLLYFFSFICIFFVQSWCLQGGEITFM